MLENQSITDKKNYSRMRRSDILNILYEDIGSVLKYIGESDNQNEVVHLVSEIIVEDENLLKRYQSYLNKHDAKQDDLIQLFQEELKHCKECQ